MYESFESLSEERRKRILDICLEEFALNGYENASTNAIVKKAEISKGILFHYFGNKKNLFLYVLDYVLDYSIRRFYELYKEPRPDIFERIIQRMHIKMQMADEEPLIYRFLVAAFSQIPEDMRQDVGQRYQRLMTEEAPLAFLDVDQSKLRKGVDPQKAIDLIMVCAEGLYNKNMAIYRAQGGWSKEWMEQAMQEGMEYMDMIRKGIYG